MQLISQHRKRFMSSSHTDMRRQAACSYCIQSVTRAWTLFSPVHVRLLDSCFYFTMMLIMFVLLILRISPVPHRSRSSLL